MDYSEFFADTLRQVGFEPVLIPNAYDAPYDPELGWPLKLPDVEFGPRTLLVMHLQDFATVRQGQVLELNKIEQHYQDRCSRILATYWNHGLDQLYHGPLNLAEFCSHNYRLIGLLEKRKHEWCQQMQQPKQLTWMSLNGRRCRHRQRVVDVLKTWPNGVVSYSDIMPLPEWTYHNHLGKDNDDNFMQLQSVYGRHAINVVTETEYDNAPGIVSEKTVLALLACQVPVVIGHRGIVQDMRDMGFDTFDDIVDNSYDLLPNEERAEQALLRNRSLLMGQVNLDCVRERLLAQQQYVMEQLPRWYEQQFRQRCRELAQQLLT